MTTTYNDEICMGMQQRKDCCLHQACFQTLSVLSSNVKVKLLVQRYHQDSGIEHLKSNLDACCRCSREHPVYLRRHKICLDWYGVHALLGDASEVH